MFSNLFQNLINEFQSNPVFSGATSFAVFGSFMYWARNLPQVIWIFLRNQFSVSFTITNDDDAFDYVSAWLARHPYAKTSRRLKLTTLYDINDHRDVWNVSPGEGVHFLIYKRRPMLLVRSRLETVSVAKLRESISLYALGRSQDIMRDLVMEAAAIRFKDDKLQVHLWGEKCWRLAAKKEKRDKNSIVLKPEIKDFVFNDLEWFMSNREWYVNRGIPYRRGYLFTGKPGVGKTSLVYCLASHYNLPIYNLNLNSISNDNWLLEAFTHAPTKAILLIEDIDATDISKRRNGTKTQNNQNDGESEIATSSEVTLSGLLNAIDGVASPDGRIVIASTNHPETLDPALIRPGRMDVHVDIPEAGQIENQQMMKRFYPDASPNIIHDISRQFEYPVSPAKLQSMFMLYPDNPEKLLQDLRVNKVIGIN